MFPPEEAGAPQSGSPEVLEEDEAELELQKQLEKGRRLRQLQQLRDSGEKVRAAAGRAAAGACGPPRGLRDRHVSGDLSPERGACIPVWIIIFV